jgi:hypothetical protein
MAKEKIAWNTTAIRAEGSDNKASLVIFFGRG